MEATNYGLADRMASVLFFLIYEEECCLITVLTCPHLIGVLSCYKRSKAAKGFIYESNGDFLG